MNENRALTRATPSRRAPFAAAGRLRRFGHREHGAVDAATPAPRSGPGPRLRHVVHLVYSSTRARSSTSTGTKRSTPRYVEGGGGRRARRAEPDSVYLPARRHHIEFVKSARSRRAAVRVNERRGLEVPAAVLYRQSGSSIGCPADRDPARWRLGDPVAPGRTVCVCGRPAAVCSVSRDDTEPAVRLASGGHRAAVTVIAERRPSSTTIDELHRIEADGLGPACRWHQLGRRLQVGPATRGQCRRPARGPVPAADRHHLLAPPRFPRAAAASWTATTAAPGHRRPAVAIVTAHDNLITYRLRRQAERLDQPAGAPRALSRAQTAGLRRRGRHHRRRGGRHRGDQEGAADDRSLRSPSTARSIRSDTPPPTPLRLRPAAADPPRRGTPERPCTDTEARTRRAPTRTRHPATIPAADADDRAADPACADRAGPAATVPGARGRWRRPRSAPARRSWQAGPANVAAITAYLVSWRRVGGTWSARRPCPGPAADHGLRCRGR